MNTRPLDKSKKSNIKCEHCKFYTGIDDGTSWICHYSFHCANTKSPKFDQPVNYYNRCKEFEWKE